MNTEAWKIKAVRMEGLLHRHDIHYTLDPKVNILGGANGSGKSTILHALACLLQSVFRYNGQPETEIRTEAPYVSIEAELYSGVKLKMHRTVPPSDVIADTYSRKGILRDIKANPCFNETIVIPEGMTGRSSDARIIYVNSSDLAVRTLSELVEKSGPNGRPGKTVLDMLLQDALNTRNQLFTARIGNAMQTGDDKEINHLQDLFSRFEKAVKRFMPEYILKDTSTLTFAPIEGTETNIPYFSLSTGEKQLLYILLTVSNTLGESTVLLLDEVDTGLHIDWKKKLLMEILTINPNVQIIAATHSPSLIDGWYDKVREVTQLYVTDKEPG